MTRRPVELHVEALVLRGFPPGEHQGTLDAVRSELERLLAEGGLPPSVGAYDGRHSVDLGRFEVAQGTPGTPGLPGPPGPPGTPGLPGTPETLGVQVARAVYRGLR